MTEIIDLRHVDHEVPSLAHDQQGWVFRVIGLELGKLEMIKDEEAGSLRLHAPMIITAHAKTLAEARSLLVDAWVFDVTHDLQDWSYHIEHVDDHGVINCLR